MFPPLFKAVHVQQRRFKPLGFFQIWMMKIKKQFSIESVTISATEIWGKKEFDIWNERATMQVW